MNNSGGFTRLKRILNDNYRGLSKALCVSDFHRLEFMRFSCKAEYHIDQYGIGSDIDFITKTKNNLEMYARVKRAYILLSFRTLD
jgi:hypothetical protein